MTTLLEYVLIAFVVIGVVVWSGTFGVMYAWYRKAKEKKCDALFLYDPNCLNTTKLPVPLAAADCKHSWSLVDKAVLEMAHEQKYVMTMKCDLCGIIDKTIEVTSKQPPPQPLPPCKHEWETVENETIGGDVGEHKVVVVLKCTKCGNLDKTVETVKIPTPPAPPVPRGECRHKWITEKSVYLDSAYEQMLKSIKTRQTNSYHGSGQRPRIDPDKKLDLDLDQAPKWMFKKGYVGIRICSLCGEIDKILAFNIDVEDGADETDS